MEQQDVGALVVAIDGPSGSGKSTVAKHVAARLGLRYLDTGATYRALALWLTDQGIDPHDATAITAHLNATGFPHITMGTDPANPTVHLNGHNAEPTIRGPEVTAAVSPVSAVPLVRQLLVDFQRQVMAGGGIVVEGRDIGTVVAPDAAVKIYLTADPQARAQRRVAEGTVGGDVEKTLAHMAERDTRDSTRATAPLTQADDAHAIDATFQSIDDVVAQVLAIVHHASRAVAS